MGELEEFLKKDQLKYSGKPSKPTPFCWRSGTPEESRAYLIFRYFNQGCVLVVHSLPSKHTFSMDFAYAFEKLCADYDLRGDQVACFEQTPDFLPMKKFVQFKLTCGRVHRGILSSEEFCQFLNQLSGWGEDFDQPII